jgi:hypothetical protein
MGSGCSDLSSKKYVCDVYNCVEAVKGVTKNSSSPSEGLILKFKENTNYEGKPLNYGFMKWFAINKENDSAIALEYEMKVYKEIIRPLIDNHICTNFIRYLSSGECDTDAIVNLLQGKVVMDNGDIMNKKESRLATTIMYDFSFYEEETNQRNVNNIINEYGKEFKKEKYSSEKIGVLINEAISQDTVSFEDWLNNWNWDDFDILGAILFQICAGIYALNLSHTAHNDLHLGNIWLVPNKEKIVYIMGKIVYTVDCGLKVLIYDFDRSYSKSLGNNVSLETDLCTRYSQCNKLIGSKDIAKVIGGIYHFSRDDDVKEYILDFLIDENYKKSRQVLSDSFSDNFYLFDPDTTRAIPDSIFMEMYSITLILARIALATEMVSKENMDDFQKNLKGNPKANKDSCDINIIQPSFFDKENGILKKDISQKIKDILEKLIQ